MSSEHPTPTASNRRYAKAYATHYTQRDLLGALRAYEEVIDLYPSAPEAEYSRSQMRNIVKLVIPAKDLLASEVALVRRRLEHLGTDTPGASQNLQPRHLPATPHHE